MSQQADSNRFSRLLEPHHNELRAYAHRVAQTKADGDDLFHEAVTRGLLKIEGLRHDEAFRLWFYRVLLSVHRNHTHRGFWSRLLPLGEQVADSFTPDLGGAERMRAALAALPTVQREAVVLHELQGMSVEEIANLQEVSLSAVKSRLARGRKRLRSVYQKRFTVMATQPHLLASSEESI